MSTVLRGTRKQFFHSILSYQDFPVERKNGCSIFRVQALQTSSQTKSKIVSSSDMSKNEEKSSPKVPTCPYLSLTSINSLKSIPESDTELREIVCVASLAPIITKVVAPAHSALFLNLRVGKLSLICMKSL